MSTRSRILLALFALTLAPLLGVAAWAVAHAVRWSAEATQLRLARPAVEAALDVRGRRQEARDSLAALGRRILAVSSVPDSAVTADAAAGWAGSNAFLSLDIESPDGARAGYRFPVETAQPCATARPAVVRAEAGALRLSGTLNPDRLLSRAPLPARAARLVVVDTRSGGTVADPWCVAAAGRLPPGAAAERSPAAFAVPLGDGEWSVVGLPGADWPAPFPESGLGLLLAAVFCALAATGGFVILVRGFWRSMDVLTTAADRIGQGDFSPWLPPPTHDEVGRLSLAIGTMAARLEQVMQQNARNRQMAAIGELASHVSHEIRNPLSSIKLNLQSIDREMRDGTVPSDLPAVIRLCLREINRLDGTVQGVLRLAATGEPMLGPCHIHAVIREALETVTPQFASRGIRVELALDADADTVRADAIQLRGVVLNLLLNAHDVMAGGGPGRIGIRSEVVDDAVGGPRLRVRFTDSGPGVRPEDRDRIFQPFYTTKPMGTGIGLPLASRTIEAHGGRLYLEQRSELEAGAEFVVELPLSAAGEDARDATMRTLGARVRWPARAEPVHRRTPETVA